MKSRFDFRKDYEKLEQDYKSHSKVEAQERKMNEKWKYFLLEDKGVDRVESITISLPKIQLNSKWGNPGSEDRILAEKFARQIKGQTFSEKLTNLENFMTKCEESCIKSLQIPELIGNLVILDTLSALVLDFIGGSRGLLFESFVAALMGGHARRVGTGQIIIDVSGSNEEFSLKLEKRAGKNYLTGSKKLARQHMASSQKPIQYVVGLYDESNGILDFYSFSLGDEELGISGDFPVHLLDSVGGRYSPGTSYLSARDYAKPQFLIGKLKLGNREEIRTKALQYASSIQIQMLSVFTDLKKLSDNLNDYFTTSPENKLYAKMAQENAQELGRKIATTILEPQTSRRSK